MGGLEAAITGIRDELVSLRKYKYSREILTLLVVGSAGMFALQNITNVSLTTTVLPLKHQSSVQTLDDASWKYCVKLS